MEFLGFRGLVTNYEALVHLKEMKKKLGNKQMENFHTVEYEIEKYLGDIPRDKVMKIVNTKFEGLTKFEKFQLVNIMPTSLVEMYLIIEECEERFTESEIQKMLAIFQ